MVGSLVKAPTPYSIVCWAQVEVLVSSVIILSTSAATGSEAQAMSCTLGAVITGPPRVTTFGAAPCGPGAKGIAPPVPCPPVAVVDVDVVAPLPPVAPSCEASPEHAERTAAERTTAHP